MARARKKGLAGAVLGAGAGIVAIIAIAVFLLTGRHAPAPVASRAAAPMVKPPATAPAAAQAAATAPAAAQAAATAPAAAQAVVAPPAADPRQAIISALGDVPCCLLTATNGAPAQVFGFTTAGNGRAALDGAMASLPPAIAPISHVRVIDGPFCTTLNILRPYQPIFGEPGADVAVDFAGGPGALREGDPVVVEAGVPGFARFLEIDEFFSDGTVARWSVTPGNQISVREGLGVVRAPFGAGLIVAIASCAPVFAVAPPDGKKRSLYIPVLRDALQKLSASGGRLSVAALPYFTKPADAAPVSPDAGRTNAQPGTLDETMAPVRPKKHHRKHREEE